jgi:NTE family protein
MGQHRQGHEGIVIAGAGARGAYEAGAIAGLLPALEREERRPTILVGTSAGAINAVLLAAHADQPAEVAGEALTAFWRELRCHDIWRPLLRSAPGTLVRYSAEFLRFPRPRLTSLLDTAPLLATARRWQEVADRAHRNVRAGLVRALAVATTDVYRGRSVVFVDLADGEALPPTDPRRSIDYVPTPLSIEHALASAAIPVAFPAIALPHPAGHRWYSDGGVRLNTPLKPAIALGAERLVVVATHPQVPVDPDEPAPDDLQPEVDDHLVNILETILVDRMVEDLKTLRTVNRALRQAGSAPHDPTADVPAGDPAADDPPADDPPADDPPADEPPADEPLREIPYVFVGPERRDSLGVLAGEVFADLPLRERLRPKSCAADLGLLRRLLASGEGPRADDPLSYLFFHPAFAAAAIEAGARDAADLPTGRDGLPWSR